MTPDASPHNDTEQCKGTAYLVEVLETSALIELWRRAEVTYKPDLVPWVGVVCGPDDLPKIRSIKGIGRIEPARVGTWCRQQEEGCR